MSLISFSSQHSRPQLPAWPLHFNPLAWLTWCSWHSMNDFSHSPPPHTRTWVLLSVAVIAELQMKAAQRWTAVQMHCPAPGLAGWKNITSDLSMLLCSSFPSQRHTYLSFQSNLQTISVLCFLYPCLLHPINTYPPLWGLTHSNKEEI